MITKNGGNQWIRCKTALRDTYGDMKDKVNTNAGMRTGKGSHDVKVCQWNMGAGTSKKPRTLVCTCKTTILTLVFLMISGSR